MFIQVKFNITVKKLVQSQSLRGNFINRGANLEFFFDFPNKFAKIL